MPGMVGYRLVKVEKVDRPYRLAAHDSASISGSGSGTGSGAGIGECRLCNGPTGAGG
jgi:hypothetical protein